MIHCGESALWGKSVRPSGVVGKIHTYVQTTHCGENLYVLVGVVGKTHTHTETYRQTHRLTDTQSYRQLTRHHVTTIRYDTQVFNVQPKNCKIANSVYHTGSETKRNNDKKIKQIDEHSSPKSSLSPRRQSRGKVREVYGRKDL